MSRKAMIIGLMATGLTCAVLQAGPNATAAAPTADKEIREKAHKSRGGGEDENINPSSISDDNDPKQKVDPPADKGGPVTRGASCKVHIDNRTSWKIQIFTGGDYQATIHRFGDLGALTLAGPTRVYARAKFVDGNAKTWGPRMFSCSSGETFTWSLWD